MPSYTEPISMENCGNPAAAQAIMMNEQGDLNRRLHVVYEGSTAAGAGMASRVTPPAPYLVPLDTGFGQPFEHSLTFDACFESGNLLRAVRVGANTTLHPPGLAHGRPHAVVLLCCGQHHQHDPRTHRLRSNLTL